jgi:peptidoglycan/xylan/chitin deacetylase (PgdA/CDA1 family)
MINKILKKILARKKVGLVFAGHGVAKEWENKKLEVVHIPFQNFKEIIELLEILDFDFLSIEEVVGLSKKKFKHHKHWTHLSFDDGYQNNYDIIYPYLKSKGIPFSIFVSTSYIESRDRFPTFWVRLAIEYNKSIDQVFNESNILLNHSASNKFEQGLIYSDIDSHNLLVEKIKKLFTEEELSEIEAKYYNDRSMTLTTLKNLASDPSVHLGAHSHLHIACHDKQPVGKVIENINTSISLLRDDWFVSKNPTYCYPNGDHGEIWVQACNELKIPLAFISDSGFVTEKTCGQLIPRFWLSSKNNILSICVISLFGDRFLRIVKKILNK